MCVVSKQWVGLYLLLLAVQRGEERLAYAGARRWGARLSYVVLRAVRAGHGIGIVRFLGVACGREHHHHSGQRQRPPLLDEAPHSGGGGGQRAEGQGQALPAGAVRTVRTARAILLHMRAAGHEPQRAVRATNNKAGALGRAAAASGNATPLYRRNAEVAISRFRLSEMAKDTRDWGRIT